MFLGQMKLSRMIEVVEFQHDSHAEIPETELVDRLVGHVYYGYQLFSIKGMPVDPRKRTRVARLGFCQIYLYVMVVVDSPAAERRQKHLRRPVSECPLKDRKRGITRRSAGTGRANSC
jgi:hypothetical protein